MRECFVRSTTLLHARLRYPAGLHVKVQRKWVEKGLNPRCHLIETGGSGYMHVTSDIRPSRVRKPYARLVLP